MAVSTCRLRKQKKEKEETKTPDISKQTISVEDIQIL